MDVYDELIKRGEPLHDLHVFKACCLYALCMYKEAKAECEKCQEDTPLKIRLLF
jgi:intraflagellar transport protein 56